MPYTEIRALFAIIGLLLLVQCCPISPIYELSESLIVTSCKWLFERADPWCEISYDTDISMPHTVRLFLYQANGAYVSPEYESQIQPLCQKGARHHCAEREAHIVVRHGQLIVVCTGLSFCGGTLIKQVRRLNHAPHVLAMMLARLRIF